MTVYCVVKILLVAEQLAVVPPLAPPHVQLQGPVPTTGEEVPVEQRLIVGAVPCVCPSLLPQTPDTAGITSAAKLAVIVCAAETEATVSGLDMVATKPPVPVQLTK